MAISAFSMLMRCTPIPIPPASYDELTWAQHPPPVEDLALVCRQHFATKPKDRVVSAAQELGWLFQPALDQTPNQRPQPAI